MAQQQAVSIADLAPELLARVLLSLPPASLLRTTPLVARAWAVATRAAVHGVQLELTSQAQADSFAAWLDRYGHGHLRVLELSCAHALAAQPLRLCFGQPAVLRELSLSGGRVTAASAAAFAQLGQLTRLAATRVTADLSLLAALPALGGSLASLELCSIDFGPQYSADARRHLAAAFDACWPALTRLTQLALRSCGLEGGGIASIACLSALAELDLSGNSLRSGEALPLPLLARLESLVLADNYAHLDMGAVLPSLSGSALARLGMDRLTLTQASQLCRLTALTSLSADQLAMPQGEHRALLSALPASLRSLDLRGVFASEQALPVAALNAALQPLSLLTQLNVSFNRLARAAAAPGEFPGGPGAALELPAPEPPLLAGCNLPQLRCLSAGAHVEPLAAVDVAQLVAACPRLASLQLPRTAGTLLAPSLRPLTRLSGSLQHLGTAYNECDNRLHDCAVEVLGQLSGLQSLSFAIEPSSQVLKALLPLTKLTSLTELLVLGWRDDPNPGGRLHLCQAPGPRHSLPVWRQLLRRCERSPECVALRKAELERELKAAKKAEAKQRRRADVAQAEVAALRAQLAAMQAAAAAEVDSRG